MKLVLNAKTCFNLMDNYIDRRKVQLLVKRSPISCRKFEVMERKQDKYLGGFGYCEGQGRKD